MMNQGFVSVGMLFPSARRQVVRRDLKCQPTLFLVFSLLLTSGCVCKPPPPLIIPQSWPSQHSFKKKAPLDLPNLIWWKQFSSPELNELIQKALLQNNNLQVAMAKIEQAQSRLDEVKLNWVPGMSVMTGYSQFPVFANPGAFVIAAPLYVINVFQLYKQQKSAQARVTARIYAKDCVRLIIIAEVSANFFTLIAQQDALKIHGNLLKHYQEQLALAQSKYGFGLTSQDDIEQLKSQVNQTQSKMAVLEQNIVVSKNMLHFLLNENPGNLVVKTSFQHLDTHSFITGNITVSLLNNRQDVHEAGALLNAEKADIGAVGAQLLPSITLGAYLGQGSTIPGGIDLLESYLNVPIVNLPVFAQIGAKKARFRAARIQYIDTVRRALRDVDNDLSAFRAYSHQLRSNASALRDEKQHCHWVERRYQHGIDNKMDVLQCQIKLNQFELTLNQNKLEKMMVIVKLYQDLAGGYHVD